MMPAKPSPKTAALSAKIATRLKVLRATLSVTRLDKKKKEEK